MSTTVNYKGNTIATLSNETKTLTTAGTWVEGNIEIVDTMDDFIVTLSYNSITEKWEPNKTFAEITNAYSQNKYIVTTVGSQHKASVSTEGYYNSATNKFDYRVHSTEVYNTEYFLVKELVYTQNSSGITKEDEYIYYETYDSNTDSSKVLNGEIFYTSTGRNVGSASPRSSTDLSVSGATVTAPAGFYTSSASKSVDLGTAGTPSASKGTVSNHQVSITPSVTNTTGYITGETKTGTAVIVTAAELASGNKAITENGTNIDVVGYSTVSVDVPSSGTAAISVVDTTDSHGGTVRTITALDISDTTAVASDVASGKYFYTANGTKTAGTGSGGSGEVEIEVVSENLHDSSEDVANTYIGGSTETSYNGWTSTGYISVKPDTYYRVMNTPGNNYNAFYKADKTSAKNSVIIPTSSNSVDYTLIKTTSDTAYIRMSGPSSGVANYEIYEVNVVDAGSGTPSATAHTIYFEFTDNTNTTITAYYDSTFISSAITATNPPVYGNKTVILAQLDGVTWYDANDIPMNTELIDFTKSSSNTTINEQGQAVAENWYYASDYTTVATDMVFSYTASRWTYIGLYNENKTVVRVIDCSYDGTIDQSDSNLVHGTISGSQLSNVAYVRLSGSGNTSYAMSLIRTA